jgi:hypothetical protein
MLQRCIHIFRNKFKQITRFCILHLTISLFFFLLCPLDSQAGGAQDRAVDVFSKIPGITKQHLEKGKELIPHLDYFNTRVFRVLCKLPNATAPDVLKILPGLSREPITFYHLELFELFSSLDEITLELALHGLQKIKELEFSSVLVASSLKNISSISPGQFIDIIQNIRQLSDPARWALKSFFEIKGQTAEKVTQGMDLIMQLSYDQCWAAEKNNTIINISVDEALKNIMAIRLVPLADVKNIRSLFALSEMTGPEAYSWLNNYFVKPQEEKNSLYRSLSSSQKSILLRVFYQASKHVIRDINNLHSIMDINEMEIAASSLATYSFEDLKGMLERLPPEVVEQYAPRFAGHVEQGRKSGSINILRQATSEARIMTARQCSAANIYILLTRVTILFDSSFRNILLPELRKHIEKGYGKSLYGFLQAMDPENLYVSRFISSLAQKGKLAMFFPSKVEEQEAILELVSGSAFSNENSLIFFAASFTKFLKIIKPEIRHILLDNMISLAIDDNAIFAQQVRIILQYYMEEQPELLGDDVIDQVQSIMETYGTAALSEYAKTPFAEWREDGVLSAVSVFNSDDDGRSSFLSNCRYLIKNGYFPRISKSFFQDELSDNQKKTLATLLVDLGRKKSGSLEYLFSFLANNAVAIDLVKSVNSQEIIHSICIYRNNDNQKKLLVEFINGDHEMFIHRGHSYWLDNHLLIPLREIMQAGKVSRERMAAKQRFLSIGSCGAINNYSELTSIFCNKIDLLGSLGSGKTRVNNLYNLFLFETVAAGPAGMSWKEVDRRSSFVFKGDGGSSYLSPGSLPAILYKIIGEGRCWFR